MNDCLPQQDCPNTACSDYGKNSAVVLHDKKLGRLRCKSCGKTWSTHQKEFYFGLKTSRVKVYRALEMLKADLPIRNIARLVDVSAGTVMRWKKLRTRF